MEYFYINFFASLIRFTQTAVASFGDLSQACGLRPAGFTRLTPEVLDWVKKTAGMQDPAGINDPGESQELIFIRLHLIMLYIS